METNGLLPQVQDFIKKPLLNLIDGQWSSSIAGEEFSVENPATGDVLAQVAYGKSADIDKAVSAARNAFESGPWARMSGSERSKLIWKLGDLIETHLDELAQLESLDNGKPFNVAKAADVPLAADMFRYMAGWATKIYGDTFAISNPGGTFKTYTLKEPVGVVGQIIPWNFPLLMAAWKLAPALATGCSVILKPAEQTPLTAVRLGELAMEAGFPPGVVNVVNGFGDTGAALASHMDVDKVAFTGSTEVGKSILNSAQGNLKKVSLELGGKSPNIIFADANLDAAIPGAAFSIFFNHGQCCCAGSRLYVEESVYEQVLEGIVQQADAIKVGDGLDLATQMGPLVSREQYERVCGFIDSGEQQGAKKLTGGKVEGDHGYFVRPTVFTNAKPDMQIVKEEIFGPVVSVFPFKSEKDLVAAANDTNYGLAAGIWTENVSKAHRVSSAIKAGTTWINCYNVFDAALPFGGYKESGWGREMGRDVLANYMETKSVCIQI
ncbi:MAG: aldehyde dehydrogenase family protein [Oligoflexales bacterium]|nr:aldehyde dehydrogenase family protein [Oligoflexales bacterium]